MRSHQDGILSHLLAKTRYYVTERDEHSQKMNPEAVLLYLHIFSQVKIPKHLCKGEYSYLHPSYTTFMSRSHMPREATVFLNVIGAHNLVTKMAILWNK